MDDAAIVQATLRGEVEAFGELACRYQQALVASARHLTGSMDDAEDLAQEAMVIAYQRLRTLQDPDKFRPWIFTILRHLCLNHLQRRPAAMASLDDVADSLAAPDAPEGADIALLLDRLPLPYREVLVAHYMMRLSYEEIAAVQDTTLETVRMRAFRARTRLKKLLHDEEEEERRLLTLAMSAVPLCPGTAFMNRVLMEVKTMHVLATPAAGVNTPAMHGVAGRGLWTAMTGWKVAGVIALALLIPGLFLASHPLFQAAHSLGTVNTKTTAVEKINPKDGATMVWIPAGEFLMGSTPEAIWPADLKENPQAGAIGLLNSEGPQHRVQVDGFWMYRNDVTVAQYRKFCTATGRAMPKTPEWGWHDDHPMVNVGWDDAAAYAQWAGAALPTEAEWEKAARGGARHEFVWGDAWPPPKSAGNFGDETYHASAKTQPYLYLPGYTDGYVNTSPVGSFTANGYGLYDMAGNVWQWCADWYDEKYYVNSPASNPTGAETGTTRVMRGGSWQNGNAAGLRAALRERAVPTFRIDSLGFRCVSHTPGP